MAVITISRQSGSEGNEIAQLLCTRLGYQYFDKKLMFQLATESGMKPSEIADASDDRHQAKGWLERAFANLASPLGDPSSWTFGAQQDAREAMSVGQVRKLIDAAYEHDNVVVVGRGGQMALADKPDVLHVRVVAPLETRIKRWQEREGLTREEAQVRVRERDAAHIDFVQRFYAADVTDSALYDLVVSTEKLTLDAAVDVIIKALESLPAKS